MIIAIGCDHAGFELKEAVKARLEVAGYQMIDVGTHSSESVDYPKFGQMVGKAVTEGKADRGIAICGSGIGISIACNKVPGIRAALCTSVEMAEMCRRHNNANVICMGARMIPEGLAFDMIDKWLETEFEGGKHERRINQLETEVFTKKGKVMVFDHPLIQHKVSLMRDKATNSKEFRLLAKEVALLMAYEVTRDLPVQDVEIETPMCKTTVKELAGEDIAIIPILRAGLGFVDGMLELVPNAKVGHVGLYRDPVTHEAIEYYCKLPEDIDKRKIIVVDPMLATGGSAVAAIDFIKRKGGKDINFMCLIAAPEGIDLLTKAHPDVHIYIAAKDEKLDENAYILPGLGDAGDRLFGTK